MNTGLLEASRLQCLNRTHQTKRTASVRTKCFINTSHYCSCHSVEMISVFHITSFSWLFLSSFSAYFWSSMSLSCVFIILQFYRILLYTRRLRSSRGLQSPVWGGKILQVRLSVKVWTRSLFFQDLESSVKISWFWVVAMESNIPRRR